MKRSMKNLGDIIKEAIRRSPKMSLRKLEILSGVTRSEISLIIHKKRKQPTPRVLRKLASALNLDYTYLYSLAGYLDEVDHRRIMTAKKTERPVPDSLKEVPPPAYRNLGKREEVIRMVQEIPDSEMTRIKDYLELLQLKVKEKKKGKR
jgi:transcriptional regulator with XRE-family HTH domain